MVAPFLRLASVLSAPQVYPLQQGDQLLLNLPVVGCAAAALLQIQTIE